MEEIPEVKIHKQEGPNMSPVKQNRGVVWFFHIKEQNKKQQKKTDSTDVLYLKTLKEMITAVTI